MQNMVKRVAFRVKPPLRFSPTLLLDKQSANFVFSRPLSGKTVADDYIANYVSLASKVANVFKVLKTVDPEAIEIPYKFVVPQNEPWPEDLYDFEAYDAAQRLRRLSRYNVRKQIMHNYFKEITQLDKLNFSWSRKEEKEKLILAAMKRYKAIHGHLFIPKGFVIGEHDINYPQQVRGLRLGMRVVELRNGSYANLAPVLAEIGFVYNIHEFTIAALAKYKEIYGSNVGIPRKFVVPLTPDPNGKWLDVMKGFPLGEMGKLRNFMNNSKSSKLSGSLVPDPMVEKRELTSGVTIIYEALTLFKKYYGHVKVPYTFVVSNKQKVGKYGKRRNAMAKRGPALKWPAHLEGLKLGERVYGIQRLHRYKNHHRDFVELGLVISASPICN